MLAKRGTVFVRGCIGYRFNGLLSQLSCPTTFSFVLFIAMRLTSEDAGYDRVGGDVTECIVCVSGYDPLTFFFSLSFLIGYEFYDPNYLVFKLVRWAGPAASLFPQCPSRGRPFAVAAGVHLRGEPTPFPGWGKYKLCYSNLRLSFMLPTGFPHSPPRSPTHIFMNANVIWECS